MSNKYRFEEIIGEIKELLEEAIDLVPDGSALERAKSYWHAHISVALDHDHDYMGGSMWCMQDTLEELDDYEEEPIARTWMSQEDEDDYIASNSLPNEGPINDDDWDDEAGRPAYMRDEDWN